MLLGEGQVEMTEVHTLGEKYVVEATPGNVVTGARDPEVALYYVPNAIMTWPAYSFIYGLNMVFLAFGSFAFHAHNTKLTHRLDIIGMYLVVIPFALYDVVFLCVPGF